MQSRLGVQTLLGKVTGKLRVQAKKGICMKSSKSSSKLAPLFQRGTLGAMLLAASTLAAAEQAEKSPTTQGAGAAQLQRNDQPYSSSTSKSGDMGAGSRLGSAAGVTDAKSFLQEAIQGNEAEIALAEVAQRKAQSPQVKQLAADLAKDHREANQKLRPIAQQHGITMNQSLSNKKDEKLDELQTLNGSEFDKSYVKAMLKDHQKDIQKYQQALRNIPESDVKLYVQGVLPTLRQHLQHAKQAAQAVGIDQNTISSLTEEVSPIGGTSDQSDRQIGGGQMDSGQTKSDADKDND